MFTCKNGPVVRMDRPAFACREISRQSISDGLSDWLGKYILHPPTPFPCTGLWSQPKPRRSEILSAATAAIAPALRPNPSATAPAAAVSHPTVIIRTIRFAILILLSHSNGPAPSAGAGLRDFQRLLL